MYALKEASSSAVHLSRRLRKTGKFFAIGKKIPIKYEFNKVACSVMLLPRSCHCSRYFRCHAAMVCVTSYCARQISGNNRSRILRRSNVYLRRVNKYWGIEDWAKLLKAALKEVLCSRISFVFFSFFPVTVRQRIASVDLIKILNSKKWSTRNFSP